MNLGLYVDRWRLGTHSQKEVDELLSFSDKAKITDLYIHVHEDRAVNDNWDYLQYILDHAKQRVHLWMSMTLGRDNEWTRDKATTMKLANDTRDFALSREAEQGTVMVLNSKSLSARKYFVDKVRNLAQKYNVYGFHIDKMNVACEDLCAQIREVTKGKYLSITYPQSQYFSHGWDIDEAIPMYVSVYSRTQLDHMPDVKSASIGCYHCNIAMTIERIQKLRKQGITPLLYSYACYTYNVKETHDQFAEALNAIG